MDVSTVPFKDRTYNTQMLQISPVLFERTLALTIIEWLFSEKTAIMRLRICISVITKCLLIPTLGWRDCVMKQHRPAEWKGAKGTPRPLLFR